MKCFERFIRICLFYVIHQMFNSLNLDFALSKNKLWFWLSNSNFFSKKFSFNFFWKMWRNLDLFIWRNDFWWIWSDFWWKSNSRHEWWFHFRFERSACQFFVQTDSFEIIAQNMFFDETASNVWLSNSWRLSKFNKRWNNLISRLDQNENF